MEEECQVEVRREERRTEGEGVGGEGRREGGRKGEERRRGEVEDGTGRRRVDVVGSLIHLTQSLLCFPSLGKCSSARSL